jgi:hypothetical protein
LKKEARQLLTEDAHAAIDAKRYAEAITKLNEIIALQ